MSNFKIKHSRVKCKIKNSDCGIIYHSLIYEDPPLIGRSRVPLIYECSDTPFVRPT